MTIQVKTLLLKKKWTIIFISFISLFNAPFYIFADNMTKTDVFVAWIVNILGCFALSTIAFFLRGKKEKIYVITLFILSILPNLIIFSYLFIASMHMFNDMFWVIFATNPSESNEYFETIPWTLVLCVASYLVIASYLLYKSLSSISYSPRKSVRENKVFFISCALILVSITSFQYLSKSFGTIDFYKSCIRFFAENIKMKDEEAHRKYIKMDVSCSLKNQGNTFIVIIGESLSRAHMHLYGYHRETTPSLDSLKNELYVYKDVVSPNTHTIAVLKNVLTFADHEHPDYYFEKPSVVELFKYAGFETYWISTQELLSKWGGSYGIIAKGSDHVYDLSVTKQTDEVILPHLYKILDQKTEKNRIIFIHLMGNHNVYKCRYPDTFNHFDYKTDLIPDKPYLDDDGKKLIDEYDNSVLYADFIISSVIKKVKEQADKSSFVLFFSDHGEEVYDYRDAVGHFVKGASIYQCEIPFILWCSNPYLEENPHLVIDEKRPFGTGDFIFSISSLAGLNYNDFAPQKSIFEANYVPRKRWVGDSSYEDIIEKTNNTKKD